MRNATLAALLLSLSPAAFAHGPNGNKPGCDIDDLADRYIAAFNSHDPAALVEVLDPAYYVTSPYGAFDRDGWIGLSAGAWYALPDIQWSLDQTVVEDDLVVFRYSFAGTFTNDFLGYTAAGQYVQGSGLEINRFDEDTCLLVRTWNYSDALGFLSQLQ